jgi:hypothetical protein
MKTREDLKQYLDSIFQHFNEYTWESENLEYSQFLDDACDSFKASIESDSYEELIGCIKQLSEREFTETWTKGIT